MDALPLSLRTLVAENHHIIKYLIPAIAHFAGPHPRDFWRPLKRAIIRELSDTLDPRIYLNAPLQPGDQLQNARRSASWRPPSMPVFLAVHDLLATRNIPQATLAKITSSASLGRMSYSTQWEDVAEYGKEFRLWKVPPSHQSCPFAVNAQDVRIGRTSDIVGLHYVQCACKLRVILDQPELHPLHQFAMWAIMVIDWNQFVDEMMIERLWTKNS